MALRRVQMLRAERWWQSLNFAAAAPFAISQGNAIISRIPAQSLPITVQVAAQYSQTGNNVNLVAYLQKRGRTLRVANCQFVITELSGDGLWTPGVQQTLIGTEDTDRRWIATLAASSIITNLCMGKSTLKVQANLGQRGKTYIGEALVNHLGIGEAAAFFRNRLLLIEASKKDE